MSGNSLVKPRASCERLVVFIIGNAGAALPRYANINTATRSQVELRTAQSNQSADFLFSALLLRHPIQDHDLHYRWIVPSTFCQREQFVQESYGFSFQGIWEKPSFLASHIPNVRCRNTYIQR